MRELRQAEAGRSQVGSPASRERVTTGTGTTGTGTGTGGGAAAAVKASLNEGNPP